QERTLTASFGVAQGEPGDSVESVLRRADKALYAAKEGGRNQTRSRSLAEEQQPAEEAEQAAAAETEKTMSFQASFYACVAAEMVVYKLGGFVNDEKAKLVEVTPTRALLKLGNVGLLPFWGGTDEKRPVEVEIDFGHDASPQ